MGIRLEYFRLRDNAQTMLLRKNCVIFCLLWKINHKFAVGSQPKTVCGAGGGSLERRCGKGIPTPIGRRKQAVRAGGEDHNILKAFTALCSWRTEIWQFQIFSKTNATVDVCGMCIYAFVSRSFMSAICWQGLCEKVFSYISAWASALLVSRRWAMPEPQFVGRVTVRLPRFFMLQNLST